MPKLDARALAALSVLVTRPAHQAEGFCRLIENGGGTARRFPVIAIAPVTDQPGLDQQLAALDQYDIAIFISANAVHYSVPHWPPGLPGRVKVAAVGNKTAARLHAHGLPVDVLAQHGYNSEALLEAPLLHAVQGKRIAIIRGVGGRELLAETLGQRGARVNHIEVYRRLLPEQTLSSIDNYQNCDIITVTSQQGLRNLITLCDDKEWLFNTALASNSQRTAALARELGFTRDIVVSSEPGDEAMAAAIANWWQSKNKAR